MATKSAEVQLFQKLWSEALDDRTVYLFGRDLGNDLHFNGFAFTQDEHDEEHPIKQFPDRPHLRVLDEVYDDAQKLIIYKSRQLIVSWFFCSTILHSCLKPGRRWLVSCKKEEAADKLLKRMYVQYQQLPEFLRPKASYKYCEIRVHHPGSADSFITAAAENAEDPRSETFSGIWIDESSFTSNLADLTSAAGPTTMAGGKLILTSTPNGRDFAYQLLTDKGRLEF